MRRSESVVGPQFAFAEPVCNRDLFANHFLKERLADLSEWQEPEGLEEAFDAVNKLYQERIPAFTDATNESQTEHDFIQPVLDILWGEQEPGDCYQVQVSIPNVDAHRQPDYAFFRHAAEREEAQERHGTSEYWDDTACLGDAKRWSASLDKQRGYDENPSAQIANYLYRSKTRWGILTNGRSWRLYEQDKSRTGGVYYEVDLEAILQNKDREAFKHFYMFFRRESCLPDQAGKSFLDKVFQGSIDYATEVGDSLKESVYDALRLLMNGFCERPANDLDSSDADILELVHENALIVLYRLLFVFFAEDRDLLPCDDEHYEGYSLRRLQGEINKQLRARHPYVPTAINLWAQVCNLFALIDEGFQREGQTIIPAYNGGLFSPEKHPHIAHTPQAGVARWEVGDNRLSEVIDMLAFQRERWDEPGTSDVDYATLAVQHLGAIYEGLLELKPQVAEQDLVEVMEDGKPVFKPEAEVPNPRPLRGQNPRRIRQGEVYLVTNRGERKATGSYYTPSYIVDYIVEHTVGPLAEEAAQKTAAIKQQVEELEASLRRARSTPTIQHLRGELDELNRQWLEPYFSLKILDPAMGSGHFLVGAADLLSLAMATDPNLPPLDEMGDEEPQVYFKRLIVERCLYGVDLNLLAVELAKLSLWLHTVSRNKALSFLDHHLRWGNSLIGAWIEKDLAKEPPRFNARGQRTNADSAQLILGFTEALTAQHLGPMLDLLRRIAESPSSTATGEHAKEALYEALEQRRDPLRQVANCWLAPFFGVTITPEQYQQAVNALRGAGAAWETLTQQEWFKQAQEQAKDIGLCFFHWELEFPECFFVAAGLKREAERGFDAVIGNPPYVDSENMVQDAPQQRVFITQRFASAKGNWDLYIPFYELSMNLACNRGRATMITPVKWMVIGYGAALRELVKRRVALIADFSHVPVFDEASIFPVVVTSDSADLETFRLESFADDYALLRASDLNRQLLDDIQLWGVAFAPNLEIVRKLIEGNPRLSDRFFAEEPFTVAEAYELTELVSEAEPGHPSGLRLVVTGTIDRYMSLWGYQPVRYLKALYRLPVVDPDALKSFSARRYEQVTSPKIVISGIRHFEAFMDAEGTFVAGKSTVIVRGFTRATPDGWFMLAVLNSALIRFYLREVFAALAMDEGINFTAPLVSRLPVPAIPFTTRPEDRLRMAVAAKELLDECLSRGEVIPLVDLVDQHLLCVPSRRDVVHDLLAALAQRMMDLNKEKHEIIERFETDLRGQADANIHERLGKGKQGRTLYKHASCQPYVKEGSGSTHHLHETLGWSEEAFEDLVRELVGKVANLSDLVGVYRNYSEDYRHVTEVLQKTDDLIDQIVYALYGLTDEEIAIVAEATTD